ncbi:phage integrase SAM-like domain-containing protein [Sphingobacterium sp. Mn56C]|uniref:phage integrase SAM-like domain-containing protein n=1 Tax=Sphingobacterium sp. Mn56C TaxID=3395261 RepID=UPI003BC64E5F
MASISATILKHHKKQNGTWAVKYRITHQGKSVYLDTNFVAKKEDLDTKLRLKKIFIDRYLSIELNKLRDKVNSLGVRLALMSVANVKTFLTKAEQGPLDFFEYSLEYLERIKHRENSYKQRISSLQRLKEFVGGDVLSPFDFKVKFLEEFQDFLKIPLRSDAIKRGGRSNQTIANTIRDIKVIFDTMKLKYNDYDNGIILIPNDPFKLYKPVVKTVYRSVKIHPLLLFFWI